MAELVPYPFGALVARAFRELDRQRAVFDLPSHRFWAGDPRHDFSVDLHGRRIPNPLGPAAGPHTQMAQNLALAWLAGGRALELKTVQVRDDLVIPRPCIDMRTVGFNAEWSQELKLEESLAEYVKGAMLIRLLAGSERLPIPPTTAPFHLDMSLGYDLAGIRGERVGGFVDGMTDASRLVDGLRREIPAWLGDLRDVEMPSRLSASVTLSTFHGCPPEEIERIARYLLEERGLDCVIKLNPTLLGRAALEEILHERLGYRELAVPESAFATDPGWERAVEMVGRLLELAARLGRGFGVKLTNTLIVENRTGFLPASEREVYLSGPPLHPLAVALVARFREAFGATLPLSFSAGIDRSNYPDAVALGLAPVTVCTDLLKKGGYGRLAGYHADLAARFDAAGAANVDGFALRAFGQALPALALAGAAPGSPKHEACRRVLEAGEDPRAAAGAGLWERWWDETLRANAVRYLDQVLADPRYASERNATPPPRIDRQLALFDCVTCDLCVPVCPNDANFTFGTGPVELPTLRARRAQSGWHPSKQQATDSAGPSTTGGRPQVAWHLEAGEALVLSARHQIGNFADLCNDCGNCDVFCPEDGAPYQLKPRFFGNEASWRADGEREPGRNGFFLHRGTDGDLVLARLAGRELRLAVAGCQAIFGGPGYRFTFDLADPAGSLAGEADPEINQVDLGPAFLLDYLRRAVLDGPRVNPVNALSETLP